MEPREAGKQPRAGREEEERQQQQQHGRDRLHRQQARHHHHPGGRALSHAECPQGDSSQKNLLVNQSFASGSSNQIVGNDKKRGWGAKVMFAYLSLCPGAHCTELRSRGVKTKNVSKSCRW